MPPQQKVRDSMKLVVLQRVLKCGKIIQFFTQLRMLHTCSSVIYRACPSSCPQA
jgi:hypothetical protein